MREELKEYIQTNGIKQKHIAEQLGISDSMISKYLKGQRKLSYQHLAKLKQLISHNNKN